MFAFDIFYAKIFCRFGRQAAFVFITARRSAVYLFGLDGMAKKMEKSGKEMSDFHHVNDWGGNKKCQIAVTI